MSDRQAPAARNIIVLADDLTGAAGAAALFADTGAAGTVALGLDAVDEPGQQAAEVLAIDLGTRDRAVADADAVWAAATWAFRSKAALVAKRIDSTLRGHVRAEIAAALEAAELGCVALVCPAFPALGRTVRGGRLFLHGRPAGDAGAILGDRLPLGVLALDTVRGGQRAAVAALKALVAVGARVVLCDAECDEDIRLLAAGAASMAVLPCDPGPLTLALAQARGLVATRLPLLSAPPIRGAALLLAVLGSRTPLTAAQAAAAERKGLLASARIHGDAVRDDRAIDDALSRGRPVLGLVPAFTGCDEQAVARALASAVASVLARPGACGLYLTGGHTARAVLEAIGVRRLTVTGSVLPLAARAFVTSGTYAGLPVVTKGGLVGGDDAFVRCLAQLGIAA